MGNKKTIFLANHNFFKMNYIFFISALIFTNFFANIVQSDCLKDQLFIKFFFEQIFKCEPFAYTLYFDKPISFTNIISRDIFSYSRLEDINIVEYTNNIFNFDSLPSMFYNNAWMLLEKYQERFNLKKYRFVKRKFGGEYNVLFINRYAFRKIVNQHLKLFQTIIDQEVTADSLLDKIESSDIDMKELLKENHILLGILLGYGEYNSTLFQKREHLESASLNLNFILSSNEHRQIIQREIEKIWDTLQLRNDYYASVIAMPNLISFVADRNHFESISLEKKYQEQSRIINQILNSDDWFEKILDQLARE